ncbi:cell wall galactomannoprotein, partial [Dipodascopsis tothii]|uniref:cell wall galactomannoprotein n=1 Tax=Dipodascopsis tothii TaxID=44089 RepID=UPI0034CE7827
CSNKTVDAIKEVSAATSTLNSMVEEYCASILTIPDLLKIQKQSEYLEEATEAAAHQVKECKPFSQQESLSVAETTLALVPLINSTLNTIVSKKYQFDHAILKIGSASGLVKKDLINLKEATDHFASSLSKKIDSSLLGYLNIAVGEIDGWFKSAIEHY